MTAAGGRWAWATAALLLAGCGSTHGPLPDPAVDAVAGGTSQTAVFAGGCFWCTEAVFGALNGVTEATPGYSGGEAAEAHYDLVSSGETNHAESVRVTFDPSKISYGQLLKVFFAVAHDPTQLNRQGPDWGRQYRSAIYYSDEEQKRVALAYIGQLRDARMFGGPIVTEVVPLTGFYPAEEYHREFVKRHPAHPYVVANAYPKLEKLKSQFGSLVRK